MNKTEVKQLIRRNNLHQKALSRELQEQLKELDARTEATLTAWAQEEFTAETMWNTGVLKKFLPYFSMRDWFSEGRYKRPVTLGVTLHVREVMLEAARQYDPQAWLAKAENRNGITFTVAGLRESTEFVERLIPHVTGDSTLFSVSKSPPPQPLTSRTVQGRRPDYVVWGRLQAVHPEFFVISSFSFQEPHRVFTLTTAIDYILTQASDD